MLFLQAFSEKLCELRNVEPRHLRFATKNLNPDTFKLLTSLPLDEPSRKKKRLGRPPHYEKYPEVISIVSDVLVQNGTAAEEKRRDSIAYGGGVTIKELLNAITTRVPSLKKKISPSTVRRFMIPPRQKTRAAKYYHSIIKAKLVHRKNDQLSNVNIDAQYAASQVNYILEFSFGFCENECMVLSCDNKNKVDVGIPAVSTFHRPQGFCIVGKNPDMPDHTFPAGEECKLIPAGYMELTVRRSRMRSFSPPVRFSLSSPRRSRSNSPNRNHLCTKMYYKDQFNRERSWCPRLRCRSRLQSFDRCNRERIDYPRAGLLHCFLFSSFFYKSTSSRHGENLFKILADMMRGTGKSVAVLVTDGGPDWNTKSMINILKFGRLWMALRLDSLVLVKYAPGQSKYNPVERRWGPLTKRLSQVILPLRLPGEKQSVFQQRLKRPERLAKLRTVFSNAIDHCCKKWEKDTYKDFGIKLHPVYCHSDGEKCASDIIHEEEHQRLKALKRRENAENDFYDELRFFLMHCSRSLYKFELTKCGDPLCRCMSTPIRATKFMSYLTAHGGQFPTPVVSSSRPFDSKYQKGHYRTLLEALDSDPPSGKVDLDAFAPSFKDQQTSIRCEKGCRYVFFSKADQVRHNIIMH